jgi:flagellar biosynthesis/type III secretory pathway chaperone
MADTATLQDRETGQVADLLRTTSRLMGVLEREIDMLRQMKPGEMQSLQEQKIVLAAAYESQIKALGADADALADLSEAEKQQLREATERFQKVLADNERALRAAKQSTDSLLQAIVGAVERQQTANSGYAANGRQRAAAGIAGRSIAIDQRF